MKYPDMNQYITLLFSFLTEFLATQNPPRRRGSPRRYTDASLLVFHAAMALKGIPSLRAQQHWLVQHPRMRRRCRLNVKHFFAKIAKNVKTGSIFANVAFLSRLFREKNAAATVARGTGPRDLSNRRRNVRSLRGHGRLLLRPRHGEGQALALRFGGVVRIATK